MEDLIKAIQDLGQYTFLDYILFGANVISVIISAFALFAAIRVPKKIAENQNKIALFEKRYEMYKTLYPIINFGESLMKIETERLNRSTATQRARHYLMVYLTNKNLNFNDSKNISLTFSFNHDANFKKVFYEIHTPNGENIPTYQMEFMKHISNQKAIIEQSAFLFDNDIYKLLKELASTYYLFMHLICNNIKIENMEIEAAFEGEESTKFEFYCCPMEKAKNSFFDNIKELKEHDTLRKIENELNITG